MEGFDEVDERASELQLRFRKQNANLKKANETQKKKTDEKEVVLTDKGTKLP